MLVEDDGGGGADGGDEAPLLALGGEDGGNLGGLGEAGGAGHPAGDDDGVPGGGDAGGDRLVRSYFDAAGHGHGEVGLDAGYDNFDAGTTENVDHGDGLNLLGAVGNGHKNLL